MIKLGAAVAALLLCARGVSSYRIGLIRRVALSRGRAPATKFATPAGVGRGFALRASAALEPATRIKTSPRELASRRLLKTVAILLVPSILIGAAALLAFAPLAEAMRHAFGIATLTSLSNDQGQFVQNFLGVIGILFSLLIGNTYYFCYNQQVMIFMAYFEEVSVAKALIEQTTLVCQGRPYYGAVLDNVARYVECDLRRIDVEPAVLLSSRPRDDPLEAIMWMTSVGTPSVIYDTVKWLRQARGARLGAMQRKLPGLHFALLCALGALELCAFPLLSAGAASTVGVGAVQIEAAVFALLAAAIALTLGVVIQLWQPSGSAYSVDTALAQMVQGLESELAARRAFEPRADTGLPPGLEYPS